MLQFTGTSRCGAIEKELQQSEQMFRNVIDGVLTVGDAFLLTNLEGKVLQVNTEFERLTGIKKSDAIGKEFPYEWLLDERCPVRPSGSKN